MCPEGAGETEPRTWRVGSHYGIHVYEQAGDATSDDDVPVATALTREFAERIVADHNRLLVEPPEPTQGNEWDRATVDAVSRFVKGIQTCGPVELTPELVAFAIDKRFKGAARDTGGRET